MLPAIFSRISFTANHKCHYRQSIEKLLIKPSLTLAHHLHEFSPMEGRRVVVEGFGPVQAKCTGLGTNQECSTICTNL